MTRAIDEKLEELRRLTGLDLSAMPPIATTEQTAPFLGMTTDGLQQDRYRPGGPTIPFTRLGRRVRYLRADVIGHLLSNRCEGAARVTFSTTLA
jgi:hypothetical protein